MIKSLSKGQRRVGKQLYEEYYYFLIKKKVSTIAVVMKFVYNYVNHLANKFGFTIMRYIYLPCQNEISGQVLNKEVFYY